MWIMDYRCISCAHISRSLSFSCEWNIALRSQLFATIIASAVAVSLVVRLFLHMRLLAYANRKEISARYDNENQRIELDSIEWVHFS